MTPYIEMSARYRKYDSSEMPKELYDLVQLDISNLNFGYGFVVNNTVIKGKTVPVIYFSLKKLSINILYFIS